MNPRNVRVDSLTFSLAQPHAVTIPKKAEPRYTFAAQNVLPPMPWPPPFQRVVNGYRKSGNPEVPGEIFVWPG